MHAGGDYMNIGEARTLHVQAHNAILEHGISNFLGDYGEIIVLETIGGRLMLPTFKGYDIKHPKYGRVQVKTRTLLDRSNTRVSLETRAVVGKNRDFDYLAHLVLDRELVVRDFVLVPLASINSHFDTTKGKIKVEDSRKAKGAEDMTSKARAAQTVVDNK
jgi:hypothetical protein